MVSMLTEIGILHFHHTEIASVRINKQCHLIKQLDHNANMSTS